MANAFIPAFILSVTLCSTDFMECFVRAITFKADCPLQYDHNFFHMSSYDQTMNRCNGSLRDVCFWYTVEDQVLSIEEENYRNLMIPLGSPELCRRDFIYTLKNGSSYFDLETSSICGYQTWSLINKNSFDREQLETIGPLVVECTDGTESSNMSFIVNVKDIDDNSPSLPAGEHLLDKSLLAIDRDSPAVNGYSSEILGGLLSTLRLSLCKRSIPLERGIVGTGLHCDVEIEGKGNFSFYTSVNFILRITDSTLTSRNGSRYMDIPININYDETTKTIECVRSTSSKRKVKRSDNDIRTRINPVVYPVKPVLLNVNASPFTRLVEPDNISFLKAYRFRLNNFKRIFNITEAYGIVYLNSSNKLSSRSSYTLNISWVGPQNGSAEVKVKILSIETPFCESNHEDIHTWAPCSEEHTEKKCTQSCGLGTGKLMSENSMVGCHWRTPTLNTTLNSNKTVLTNSLNVSSNETMPTWKIGYHTCVADSKSCPDNWCDPHEELNIKLCPQDCTISKLQLHVPDQKSPRGIGSTVGLCTCDYIGSCSCSTLNGTRKNNGNRSKLNGASITATSSPTLYRITDEHTFAGNHVCGTACLAAVMTICLLLSAIVTLVLCKLIGDGSKKDMKLENTHIHSTDTLISLDPVATPITEPAADNASALLIDHEWEFPRERMKIDFCLGEGEFGKVLKAKAINIAGIPGVTTVAVKTLKDGAGEAELADLLSEYQMLKELSHPNVIKLLGASTLPGGPVYLIMEFASHGSLKSYLRRHRPIENSSNPNLEARMDEHSVTPKDILSFAWQIAKGMAYLSDMKLVHRDLAARNILVATGKICKISDFGLTRDIYEDETYLKRSKGRVPVKWMALESLSDHIYTTKSDVWGFGILLWELVTLGSSPYPGVAVQNLFYLLKSGYRMEKPRNCSHQLYEIMRSCWFESPFERPSFHHLRRSLEVMLEDGTDYLDLNAWFVFNRVYFSELLLQKDKTLDTDSSSDTENANNSFGGNGTTSVNIENKLQNNEISVCGRNILGPEIHYSNENVTMNSYKNLPFEGVDSKLVNASYVNSK